MRFFGWTLLTLFLSQNAFAVLGEKPTTAMVIVKSQTAKSQTPVQYSDHTENSIAIREYVHPDGTVFAVRWHGHLLPSREALLGSYYGEYKIATTTTLNRIPRRGLTASSEHLTISQFGHPGDLHGFVVLKDHVPVGLKLEELP